MNERNSLIWDRVWQHDSYSDHNLRSKTAKFKINHFEKMAVPFKESVNILEIGCGSGFVARELIKKYSIKITAIDYSQVAIMRRIL